MLKEERGLLQNKDDPFSVNKTQTLLSFSLTAICLSCFSFSCFFFLKEIKSLGQLTRVSDRKRLKVIKLKRKLMHLKL